MYFLREAMDDAGADKPDYGNWMAKRYIVEASLMCLLFLGLSFLSIWLLVIAAFFFLVVAYCIYAQYVLSERGGGLQADIRSEVLDRLEWDGEERALDIGCGAGALTIDVAKKYPRARVTGVDLWGPNRWGYSKEMCEKNASIEGVNDRVDFTRASAAALPFDDGCFDAVVSNRVFHMVKDSPADRREVVREALRVLRKGGKFSFQDLFLDRKAYGDPDELVRAIKSWGMNKVEFTVTKDAPYIPRALKFRFMIGDQAVIWGEK